MTTQFLGWIFRNNPAIEFPANAAGIRLAFAPNERLEFQMLVQDADDDWEDIFNNVFTASQVTITPELFGRSGHYRLFGWLNDAPHTKWLTVTDTQERGYGFGLSLDQEVMDNIGVFARYGWQDPEVYLESAPDFSLDHSWSAGIQLDGDFWNREDDVLGLAFGQVSPSGDYKNADTTRNGRAESHLEMYYNYKHNEHLSLSPDIQVIWDPYGDDASIGDDTIVVFGTRAQVNF